MNGETYVPIEEITEKLQISKRTVYYELEKINAWLKEQNLAPVNYARSSGFYLSDETRERVPSIIEKMQIWHYYFSEKERRAWLTIHLILRTHPLFLKDLMEEIRVSRGTTNKVLNQLKEELSAFDLTIMFDRKQGYLIQGKESDKRKALVHYFPEVLSKDGWNHLVSQIQHLQLNEEQVSTIYQIIHQCESELGIRLTDEMVHNLAFRLVLFSNRLIQGERVVMDEDEKKVLESTSEYVSAKNICKKLENLFLIEFPDDEVCYITMNFLGAKVNSINHDTNRESILKNIKLIIQRMVDDFQKYACVFFQDRSALEENMLIHMKPAYYRLKYGLEVENPLTETIKQKYSEVFEVTKKVIYHLEDFVGRKVSEKEIAYIAMHFGGWMKREGSKPIARKKGIIVCGNGVSTSRILQTQLENLFSSVDIVSTVSLREYESQDFDADFIVSTAPIKKRGIPVFFVSPILTETEKETLLNQINNLMEKNQKRNNPSVKALMDIIKRHANITNENSLQEELSQFLYSERQFIKEPRKPMLHELITEEMIQFKPSVDGWTDAIRIAADPLLKKGYINQDYVEAMIQNVYQLGPYIVVAPKVAIPHARPEQGVNQLGMSLLCLKESVPFSDQEKHNVNLIIIMAPIDAKTHLKALTQLSGILQDSNNINAILEAETSESIIGLINQYSIN